MTDGQEFLGIQPSRAVLEQRPIAISVCHLSAGHTSVTGAKYPAFHWMLIAIVDPEKECKI
jgi:hypothetical protein